MADGSITRRIAVMLPMEIEERPIDSEAGLRDNSDRARETDRAEDKGSPATGQVQAQEIVQGQELVIDRVAARWRDLAVEQAIALVAEEERGPAAEQARGRAGAPVLVPAVAAVQIVSVIAPSPRAQGVVAVPLAVAVAEVIADGPPARAAAAVVGAWAAAA